jgi:hypothetical protein
MSHLAKIELEIKDLAALRAAVQNLGYEFRENQQTYAWYGRWVGDSPLPDGVSKDELGKCSHAIRVPGCSYEIGVVQKGQNYILLWDYWSAGGLSKVIGNNAGVLKQAYTLERIRKESRLKGYLIHEARTQNGIRISLTQSR